jgi:outer membrane protein assembly factor BamB
VNTNEAMDVGRGYFGVVSSPLVVGDMVVQNFGAPPSSGGSSWGPCVGALDLETGEPRWGAGDQWGPSCASPVLATIGGEERILVIAGGETRPPVGGLLILTTEGKITTRYPFRSRTTLSVNGPSPVPMGDSVFLTAAYNVGSAVVDVDEDGKGEERWRDRRSLALEFATPVFVDGRIVAVDGVSGRAGALVAIDPKSGEELIRTSLTFDQEVGEGDRKRTLSTSLGKGTVMVADGALWALGDTGQLVTVKQGEEDFEVISQAPLFYAAETWTPPVICNGLLYVCQNNRGRGDGSPRRLLCYDVRGE